jgi:hypothetical protein
MPQLGTDEFAPAGGGVPLVPDGRGLAVIRANAGVSAESALYTGSWATLAAYNAANSTNYVSVPIPTATGALVAHAAASGADPISLDTWDDGTSAWTTETTGVNGDNQSFPTVATTAAGDPLVLFSQCSGSVPTYDWVARTAGTWGAAAVIPGLMAATCGGATGGPSPAYVNAKRAGADQIVAVLRVSSGTTLQAVSFSAGAWSSATTVATDAVSDTFMGLAIAALPDGRVALAYETTARGVSVGFFDGSTWSAFQAVPTAALPNSVSVPLSVAHGGVGAVLELAYVDASLHLQHTRLLTETPWVWSTPAPVDASQTYGLVSIAVGP